MTTPDHARLCQGREYTCTCGHDEQQEAVIHQLLTVVIALVAFDQNDDLIHLKQVAAETVFNVYAAGYKV
jgi:hypothetical protein